jgi:hypothetical protein
MISRFTGDYGLTPNEANDLAVINLISQMGDNPSNPKPATEAIAVWLANRWSVDKLSDLQFLWNPERTETYGADEAYNVVTYPGYFTAVSKSRGIQIPNEFAQFDDGKATYYLGFKPNAEGKPSFGLSYANPRTRGVLREVALPLLAIGSLVYDWSGQLGYAILGVGNAAAATNLSLQIALASGLTQLQVAQLVGSAAVGAVTSGGDVGEAVKNTAAAYLGSQAGNFVAAAVDSAAAAQIASAAVSAAARGEDVGLAILETGAPLAAGAAAGAVASTTGATVENYLFPNETGFINPSELVGFDEFYDFYTPPVDFGNDYTVFPGDVIVSPEEMNITGPITIDESALQMTGFDPDAVIPDEDGDLYDVSGQTVAYTAKTYANSLYVDPQTGDVYGPDNIRRLTASEAAAVVAAGAQGCSTSGKPFNPNIAGLGAVCLSPQQSIAQEVQRRLSAQAGQVVIPGPGAPGRPAGLPPPNPNGVKMPEAVGWAAAAEAITRSAASVWSIITQVSNGTYRPGATSPYGTVRPPVPGVPVRQADGSTVVNNGNGTQTVTYPNGTTTTMSTAVAGTGSFGGISTNTLLIAGAGLAALLLLRRK